LQLQAGRGDDDVGIEVRTGFERDTGGVEVADVVGDHGGAALADRGVEVGVGDQAHPLVPRVVARLEVGVDVVSSGQVVGRTRRSSHFTNAGNLRDKNQNTASIKALYIRMTL